MSLSAGVLVAGRFMLERPLGQGGMGAVWRAQHVSLRIPCAVKFIHAHAATSPEARERFEREAQSAAQLRSPNVVQILDHGVWEGLPYIAMELLEGEDLQARLRRQGMLDIPELVSIVSQVARALTKAQALGLVHRDLKPANIFLVKDDDQEIAKVLDFGVAKIAGPPSLGEARTETGALLGTPFYMSPEQAQGTRALDGRSDLWSLAVIAFQGLTGQLPFESQALGDLLMKIMVAPLPVPSEIAPVPPEIDAWWSKAAARDPAQRFQTGKELSEALAVALGVSAASRPVSEVSEGSPPRAPLSGVSHLSTVHPAVNKLDTVVPIVSSPPPAEQAPPPGPLPRPDIAAVALPPAPVPVAAPSAPSVSSTASMDAPLAPRPQERSSRTPLYLGGALAVVGAGAVGIALFLVAGRSSTTEGSAPRPALAAPDRTAEARSTAPSPQPSPGSPVAVSPTVSARPSAPPAAVLSPKTAAGDRSPAPAPSGTNLAVGAACGVASQCKTGFCVDGVCCDSACTDRCMACTAAKKHSGGGAGYCGFISGGEDPDHECGAGKRCDGVGSCVPMTNAQIKALTGP
ncbi:MAG: serine/threonine-protein kinase [Byssovorax sp.]